MRGSKGLGHVDSHDIEEYVDAEMEASTRMRRRRSLIRLEGFWTIKIGVWKLTRLSQCLAKTHRRPTRGRWVDINKGDVMSESKRSTSVARLFAAMRPLEASRVLAHVPRAEEHALRRTHTGCCPLRFRTHSCMLMLKTQTCMRSCRRK